MGVSAAIGSAAIQMYGASKQADAQRAQADFQADQARANAKLLDLQREEVFKQGEEDVRIRQQQIRGMLGTQSAMMAAQGISIDSEVVDNLAADTKQVGIEDAQAIRNNAWREAWGLEVESNNLRETAKFTKRAGETSANNTMLIGGASAVSTMSKGGVFDNMSKGSK